MKDLPPFAQEEASCCELYISWNMCEVPWCCSTLRAKKDVIMSREGLHPDIHRSSTAHGTCDLPLLWCPKLGPLPIANLSKCPSVTLCHSTHLNVFFFFWNKPVLVFLDIPLPIFEYQSDVSLPFLFFFLHDLLTPESHPWFSHRWATRCYSIFFTGLRNKGSGKGLSRPLIVDLKPAEHQGKEGSWGMSGICFFFRQRRKIKGSR